LGFRNVRPMVGPLKGPKFTPLGASKLVAFILALRCLGAAWALAHEGHDHEQPVAAATAPGLPRLATSSEAYELVAILEGERLTICLDHFEDNSPVIDANISVTVNEETMVAALSSSGT
jgi:membrane fusion protein, heavy metal efflux system